MKRILVVLFSLCCTLAAFGQFGKPASQEKEKQKVAVYVTSGDEEGKLNDFVGDYIVDAIVRSGKYTAIERTDDFLKQVAKAHEHQRSGAVDDSRIAKLGAQFGEQFVCVVKVGSMGEDKNYLSARIVDVETAKVTKSSKPFTFTIDDLSDVCEDVIAQLFGSTMSRTFGKPKTIKM